MQNLSTLAVFVDTAVCDGCGREATLTTDGVLGYAYETDWSPIGALGRTGSVVVADCLRETHGEPCHGRYEWDLSSEGAWIAATNLHREALNLADRIEQ